MKVDNERIKSIYAVLVEFHLQLGVNLTGNFSWESLPDLVGLDGTSEGIVAQLIRMDTADAFNISANNVTVSLGLELSLPEAAIMRRTLLVDANVSALLEVNISKDASSEEVAAAISEKEVSADLGIQMLSEQPDKFFGRTTTTLGAKASTVGNVTSEVVTPEDTCGDSDFFDNESNVVGLVMGIVGGLLITLFLARRFRRVYQRRRVTMYASVYGQPVTIPTSSSSGSFLAGIMSAQRSKLSAFGQLMSFQRTKGRDDLL